MSVRDQIADAQIAKLRRIFEREVSEIRDSVKLLELQRLVESKDADGVIKLLGINRAAFSDLEQAVTDAFKEGGAFTANAITPIPVQNVGDVLFRFDASDLASVAWIREHSSTLVVEIVEQQREMIRERIADNVARGIAPRTAALDLVGRIDNTTKKRVGGFIGLTNRQAASVAKAREQLEGLDPKYLERKLRDKRLDASIIKAIESGEPLSQKQIDAAVTRLQARTLKHRGNMIARTEALNGLRAGEQMAIAQAIELGELDAGDVVKEWDSSGDSRVRIDHMLLDGQVKPLLEPFVVPLGGDYPAQELMYAGDTSRGASGGMTIACRCRTTYRIDFIGKAVRKFKGFG